MRSKIIENPQEEAKVYKLARELARDWVKVVPNDLLSEVIETPRLHSQFSTYVMRKARRILRGVKPIPTCNNCKGLKIVQTRGYVTHRTTESLRITEYAMKRIYAKGKLDSRSNKTWVRVGWICPNCYNMITDEKWLAEQKKADKEALAKSKDMIKGLVEKLMAIRGDPAMAKSRSVYSEEVPAN